MNNARDSVLRNVARVAPFALVACITAAAGCASTNGQEQASAEQSNAPAVAAETAPPPRIQAWMDRLTVDHEYDPETGFIVAREVVTLPALIAEAPTLDKATAEASGTARIVIAFATADRCAPCPQDKRDAATHVEVDTQTDLADTYLGSRGIPMTYAIRNGERIATFPGQRSASDLVSWRDSLE